MDETEFIDPISLDVIPSDRVVEVKEGTVIWHMDVRFLLENILIHNNRLNVLTRNPLSKEVLDKVNDYRQKHLRVVIITQVERDMFEQTIRSVVIDDLYLVGDLHVRCVLTVGGDITKMKVMLNGISLTERTLEQPITELTTNEVIKVTVGRSSIRGEHYTSLKKFVSDYNRYSTMFSPFPTEDIPNAPMVPNKKTKRPRVYVSDIEARIRREASERQQSSLATRPDMLPPFIRVTQPSVPSFEPPFTQSFGPVPQQPSSNRPPPIELLFSVPSQRPSSRRQPPSVSQPVASVYQQPSFVIPERSFTETFGRPSPSPTSFTRSFNQSLPTDIRPSERLAMAYSSGMDNHITALNTPNIPSFATMTWKIIDMSPHPKYDIEPLMANSQSCIMNSAIRAAISTYNSQLSHPVRDVLLKILTGAARQKVIDRMPLPSADLCPDIVPDAVRSTVCMRWYPLVDESTGWTWDIFNSDGVQPVQPPSFVTGTRMTRSEVEAIRSYNELATLSPIFVPHGQIHGINLGRNAAKVVSEWSPLPDPSLTVMYVGSPDTPYRP